MRFMMVCIVSMIPGFAMAQSGMEGGHRPINFTQMDINGDGSLTMSEWRAWFYDDIRRRSLAPPPVVSGPTVQTSEGMITLTRRARPVIEDSAGAFEQEQRMDALRSQGLARELTPLEKRDRIRSRGKGSDYIPTFEEFDLNQDGRVTARELAQGRVRPATPRQP